MRYPESLVPTLSESIELPSGAVVEVPKCKPIFTRWKGRRVADTYGGKPVLEWGGNPVFAELVILGLFRDAGWDGVWVDSFKDKYRTGYWGNDAEAILPPDREIILRRIAEKAGGRAGCWDVFCWTGDHSIFVESKRAGRDRLRKSQFRWLGGALSLGFPVESFLVVEWSQDQGGS